MISSLQLQVGPIPQSHLSNAMLGTLFAGVECKREKPWFLKAYFMQQFSENLNGDLENKLISILSFPRLAHSFIHSFNHYTFMSKYLVLGAGESSFLSDYYNQSAGLGDMAWHASAQGKKAGILPKKKIWKKWGWALKGALSPLTSLIFMFF